MVVRGTEAPAGHIGFLLFGPPPRNPLNLGNGLITRIDPSLILIAHQFQTGNGGAWSHSLPIPNDGGLIGGSPAALWRVFLAPPSPAIHATNGVLIKADRR